MIGYGHLYCRHFAKLKFDHDIAAIISYSYCVALKYIGLSWENGMVVRNGAATLDVIVKYSSLIELVCLFPTLQMDDKPRYHSSTSLPSIFEDHAQACIFGGEKMRNIFLSF